MPAEDGDTLSRAPGAAAKVDAAPAAAVTWYPGMEAAPTSAAWLQALEDCEAGSAPVGFSTAESAALERTAQFSEATRRAPGDVALWLRYVAFQPEALHAAGTGPLART